jgi:hypothetical protein
VSLYRWSHRDFEETGSRTLQREKGGTLDYALHNVPTRDAIQEVFGLASQLPLPGSARSSSRTDSGRDGPSMELVPLAKSKRGRCDTDVVVQWLTG